MATTTVGPETRECVPKEEETGEDDDLGGSVFISPFFEVQADSKAAV